MFTTGPVLLPFFSLMSYLIAVPTGIKYFNWIGTMWRGSVKYSASMLFAVGFPIVFLFGGVTGVLLASPPVDFATHDTYFVVAHFHQVLAGSAKFAGFSAIYYWYPKMTGRMLRERLGKTSSWFLFVGFLVTFTPQYLVGLHGMPRWVATYALSNGWTGLNRVSTAGSYLLFVGVANHRVELPCLVATSGRRLGEPMGRTDTRVGDELPSTRTQLQLHSAYSLGAPSLGREPSRASLDMRSSTYRAQVKLSRGENRCPISVHCRQCSEANSAAGTAATSVTALPPANYSDADDRIQSRELLPGGS